jgi:hypothetical protein
MVRLFGGGAGGGRRGVELARGLVVVLAVVALCLVVPGKASAAGIDLTGISPSSATQGETVEVTLTGTGFADSMTAKITEAGGTLIVDGSKVSVTGSTEAVFRFEIPAKAPVATDHLLTVVKDTYEASKPFGIQSLTKSITFNGDDVLGPPLLSLYVSQNNTVEMVVETNSADAEVKFGSVATIKADGTVETRQTGLGTGTGKVSADSTVYTVEYYPLRPGANRLSITVRVGKKRDTFRFTINYPAAPTVGAEHYVGDIMGERKVDAFGKTVVLDFGRSNYLTDKDGAFVVDQSVIIDVVYAASSTPPTGFVSISPVFKVAAAETDHRIGMPGTLTFKYTGLGAVPENITVFRSTDAGNFLAAENIGGLVSQRAGTITVAFEGEFHGYYGVFTSVIGAETYADLPTDGWYYHAVSALRAKGAMEPASADWGYASPGANEFGLSSSFEMCRGEFAFMMVRALGLPLLEVTTFTFTDAEPADLGNNSTYARAVETAAFHGLIRGYPDHTFHPRVDDANGLLTREQAAAIIVRAAGLRLNTIEASVNASLERLYTDWEEIPSWARSSVLACHRAGLMTGFLNAGDEETYSFYGTPTNKQLTRAQAAAVVHRFMENQKLI